MVATFRKFLNRLGRDEQGQDLIEYALLATFVTLVAIAGATLLGDALNGWYASANPPVETAPPSSGTGT